MAIHPRFHQWNFTWYKVYTKSISWMYRGYVTKDMQVKVKIFLAAYTIAWHPKYVFEDPDGELEQQAYKVAGPFLECLHKVFFAWYKV